MSLELTDLVDCQVKRSTRKGFRRLFEEVVRQRIKKMLVSGRLAAAGPTHVKANASQASEALVELPDSTPFCPSMAERVFPAVPVKSGAPSACRS